MTIGVGGVRVRVPPPGTNIYAGLRRMGSLPKESPFVIWGLKVGSEDGVSVRFETNCTSPSSA